MDDYKQRREELLLDLHLDRIEPDERDWLTAELRRDADLRAANDRLCRLLQPLDHWTIAAAPTNLADRIIRHVERSRQELLAAAGSGGRTPLFRVVGLDESAPTDRGSSARGWLFSMRDLIAVAACVLLVFSVLVPGVRSRAQQGICRTNMHTIGEGVGMYRDMTASLPFADVLSGAPWLPSSPSATSQRRPHQSNSRHAFLLVKYGFVPSPNVFVCGANFGGKPMSPAGVAARSDFEGAYNNNYDSLNMAGDTPPLRPSRPLVYLSDRSPIFLNGRFNEEVDPDTTNSPTHGGKGQNILRTDGSVEWIESPIYGPQKDNLWLSGEKRRYDGTETVTDPDETFLIPGYPAGADENAANRSGP